MIPYGKQEITQSDIDAVVDVLKSDFLTQGPQVPLFEQALRDATGAAHAVAVNSATSALHIACMALGLGEGDWLWTSPITFVASANAGLYCGAKVDFVDVCSKSYNVCPVKLEEKLIEAERIGMLPKVVIPVHLCGQSCDMKAIKALSVKYGFHVIEDASHAVGAEYMGGKVGSCEFSDITVFSFHPVKIVTTAEGGAALTNNEDLARKMELLRSHGVTRDQRFMQNNPHGSWYYEQVTLGYNYRMTELQAALGVSQMNRLNEFVAARQALAQRYDELLRDLPLTLPFQLPETKSAYHLYVIRLDLNTLSKSHPAIFDELRENGIGVNLHYMPVYKQPYYEDLDIEYQPLSNSEAYYASAISIPIFHGMTFEQQDAVVDTLKRVLN